MPCVSRKTHKYWGYKYDLDCPVDENRRNQIAKLMRKRGLKSKNIEFRGTGLRYGYWSHLDCISEISRIAPISQEDWHDSDCGELFYYEWL